MTRPTRSENELRAIREEHLRYEIDMFLYTVEKAKKLNVNKKQGIPTNHMYENMLLESFCIHVRALIEFFYTEKPRKDDAIAEDFLPREKWKTDRPRITQVLEKAKERANKEIAHLTYARLEVTPTEKPWEFNIIADHMNLVIEKFEDLLKQNH